MSAALYLSAILQLMSIDVHTEAPLRQKAACTVNTTCTTCKQAVIYMIFCLSCYTCLRRRNVVNLASASASSIKGQ